MSIITEIKKFNRKYTIITHMQDSALPADSEVLLEGVVVVYTPTGELKDAEKCKVGDGVTEFCNLPWLGGEEVVLEDLTAELQRQDELLTLIETFLNSIKTVNPIPGPESEPTEPYWYFVYNRYPGIHTLEDGYVYSAADPWSWAIEGNSTDTVFSTSPVESYSLELLDKTKTYICVNGVNGGSYADPYYAKLTYGIPPKMWLFEDVSIDATFTFNFPWIYENHIYDGPDGYDIELYYPNGDYRVIAPGFDLNELDPTVKYTVAFAGLSGGGTLRFGYPSNPGGSTSSGTWIIFGTNSPDNYFTYCEEDNKLWSTLYDANWEVRLGSETVISPWSDGVKEGYSSYVNLSELDTTSVYSIVDNGLGYTYTLVYSGLANNSNYALDPVYDSSSERIEVKCSGPDGFEVDFYLLEGSSQNLGAAIQVSSRIAVGGNSSQIFYYGEDFTSSITAVVAVCWKTGNVDAVLICNTSH